MTRESGPKAAPRKRIHTPSASESTSTIVAVDGDMTPAEAAEITSKIKAYIGTTWAMLADVHDRKGYVALGYKSFEEYLRVELDVSRSRGYRLVDQAKVIGAITEAAKVSPAGDIAANITERQARDIKPILSDVVDAIEDRVERGETPEVVVPEVIAAARDDRRWDEEWGVRYLPNGGRRQARCQDRVVLVVESLRDICGGTWDYVTATELSPDQIEHWRGEVHKAIDSLRKLDQKLAKLAQQ
jgi:hypothetical protein